MFSIHNFFNKKHDIGESTDWNMILDYKFSLSGARKTLLEMTAHILLLVANLKPKV